MGPPPWFSGGMYLIYLAGVEYSHLLHRFPCSRQWADREANWPNLEDWLAKSRNWSVDGSSLQTKNIQHFNFVTGFQVKWYHVNIFNIYHKFSPLQRQSQICYEKGCSWSYRHRLGLQRLQALGTSLASTRAIPTGRFGFMTMAIMGVRLLVTTNMLPLKNDVFKWIVGETNHFSCNFWSHIQLKERSFKWMFWVAWG